MDAPNERPAPSALGAAVLFCETCGKDTVHRILHVEAARRTGPRRAVSGVARCRECRWTHAFVSVRARPKELELIVSEGERSRRGSLPLAPSERLRVGEPIPGLSPLATVTKLDLARGGTAAEAVAEDVATVWATSEAHRHVRVAVMVGSRSTTKRLPWRADLRLTVGDPLALEELRLTIVGLRARGHTWRRPGDSFPASEVAVVYARRAEIPPAGRSAWRRERGIPSARASSTSSATRSRSSPGVRRYRTVPRARTAAGGAAVQRSSFS